MNTRLSLLVCFLISCTALTEDHSLAIVGTYVDNWDTTHEITDATWVQTSEWGTSAFSILSFDNDAHHVTAQNDLENDYYPDLFSHFEWMIDGDGLWVCQSAYDASTEEDADATASADGTDPESTGCGGASWSLLTAIEETEAN